MPLILDHAQLEPHRYNGDCLIKRGGRGRDCGVVCHYSEYRKDGSVVQCDCDDPDAPVHQPHPAHG